MANGYWTSHGQLTEAELAAVQLAVANGIATYAAGEIEKLAGIPNIAPLLALAEVNAYPRSFTVARSAGPTNPIVMAAAAFNGSLVASNPSGNLMRIRKVGTPHGMGVASDGQYLWVKTTAGVPTGVYPISTRAVSDEIDVDVGAVNQSLIATTAISAVSRYDVAFPVAVIPIPAGVLGPNGTLEIGPIQLAFSASTATKTMLVTANTDSAGVGGTVMGSNYGTSTSTHYGTNQPPATLVNQNSVSVQRLFGPVNTVTGLAPSSATINTDSAFYVAISLKLAAMDEFINLVGWRVDAVPGL